MIFFFCQTVNFLQLCDKIQTTLGQVFSSVQCNKCSKLPPSAFTQACRCFRKPRTDFWIISVANHSRWFVEYLSVPECSSLRGEFVVDLKHRVDSDLKNLAAMHPCRWNQDLLANLGAALRRARALYPAEKRTVRLSSRCLGKRFSTYNSYHWLLLAGQ